VCVVVLHTGALVPHVVFATQATQVPAAVSHAGVAPVHFAVFVAEHAPHAPDVSQTGVAPPHSPSTAQARHTCAVVLHTGIEPEQSAFVAQPTQAPVATLQTEIPPVHFVEFVAEHAPHEPPGWQAGVLPPQSTSPAHARQVCVVGLQTGALPPQSAPTRHPTQTPVVVRHWGVGPPHAPVFVAEHWPQVPEVSQAGVEPPHSPSPAQPRHRCVIVLQIGDAPAQSAFERQGTQLPVAALHSGVAPTQRDPFVAEHWPQAPEAWQAGAAPPHSPSPAHARQVCVPALQTGVAPAHCAFVKHPTQVCDVVLQTGVAPAHCAFDRQPTQVRDVALQTGVAPVHADPFVAEHWPQAPEASQAGVVPPHSPSPAHARQVCVPVLHTGVDPPHCAFVRHEAHVPVAVLQTGVAPMHCVLLLPEQTPQAPVGWQAGAAPWQSTSPAHARQTPVVPLHTGVAPVQAAVFVDEHWPHAPPVSHAGVEPPHSPSLEQPRQVCVAPLQTGVAPLQSALAVHRTHVPVVASQTGVPPTHCDVFPGEHWPQAPEGWHAGAAPPQSTSPAHARQVCVVPLHTGVAPLQSALAVHRTHVPAVVSQTGVLPAHCVALPAEHCAHAPEAWQAGVVPPHSPSPPHARHVRKAGSQIGLLPAQSALPRQPTQVFVAVLHSGATPPQVALVTHSTHVAVPMSQADVAPPQWELFVAEHWPQAPLPRHTGAVAGQSVSAAHALQAFAEPQTGVVPEQFVLVRQATQILGEAVVRQ
jgi:hypothetical protein